MTGYQEPPTPAFDPNTAREKFMTDLASLIDELQPTDASRYMGEKYGKSLADPYRHKGAIRWLEAAIIHIGHSLQEPRDSRTAQLVAEALVFIQARHTTQFDRDELLYGGAVDR